MQTHKRNLMLLLANVLLASSVCMARTNTAAPIQCVFSTKLVCKNLQNIVLWSDSRFVDFRPTTMVNGRLYLSHNNNTFSYDARTGKLIWQASSKNEVRYFYPIVNNQHVYLASTDGILEKRQANSGEIIWTQKLGNGWIYPPVILNEKVITGGQDRKIWLIDANTGDIQQSIELDQELVAPLSLVGDNIIASTFDSQLNAYQLSSFEGIGKPIWQTKISAPVFTSLNTENKHVIVSDMGGNVTGLSPNTGKIIWQKDLHKNARFWNVLHQQSFYSLSESGVLKTINSKNGKILSSFQLTGDFSQPPIVQGDSLVLFDTSGSTQRLSLDKLNKNQNTLSLN